MSGCGATKIVRVGTRIVASFVKSKDVGTSTPFDTVMISTIVGLLMAFRV